MAKATKVKEDSNDKLLLLEEKYGKGSVVRADTIEIVTSYTPTSSLTLNRALGIGGIPKQGKITHILGQPSSGKTTLASDIIANEQIVNGQDCALLDIENTYDLAYAQAIGVDLSRLYLINVNAMLKKKKAEDIQAISGEEWLDLLGDLISTKRFGIVVLDSIAELCPMAELLAGNTQGSIAGIGRLMSKSLRGITARLMPTDTGLILLNQYRMSPGKYGNPYIEAAGEALRYYAAVKLELTAAHAKEGTDIVGLDVRAKVTKSKIGIPHKEGNYYITFGLGIEKMNEVLTLAEEAGLFEKSGSHYSYKGTKIANGYDNMLQAMKDNPEMSAEIESVLMDKLKQ